MKKQKLIINIISNAIILICIFSVFQMCFAVNVSSATVSSSDAIYNGNKDNNKVSLMINVYWGTEHLDSMLNTLKETNAKATFFVGGYWASKNETLLKRIMEEGHEIGNHGYYHKDHDKLNFEQNLEEISINHQVVKSLCGIDMNLFAPPSGAYNQTTLKAADDLGYKTIMWTKDTIDWRDQDETLILNRATKNMCGGDLILMHPTKATASVLKNIITEYQNAGFNLVSVTENLV